jgi:hypothetical protein
LSFIAQRLSTDLLPERQQIAFRQAEFGRAFRKRDGAAPSEIRS